MSDQNSAQLSGSIAWMARHPVAANLLMWFLIGAGIWTTTYIQKEVSPESQLDQIEIRVGYPGAAPDEVEYGVILPIEEAIRSVSGIKQINSRAREGNGRVEVELVAGIDRTQVLQDVEQAVNRIRTFPEEIEKPEISLNSNARQVISVILYGDLPQWDLRKLTEQVRDQLLSNPKITQIEFGNIPDYVSHIEIPMDTLRQYQLTLNDIANKIEASSRDVSAGVVETKAGEVLLKLKERRQWAEEWANIELISHSDGGVVKLGDIAQLRDGFEEGRIGSQFDQMPAIELEIFRIGAQSPSDIESAVLDTMKDIQSGFPKGVKWEIYGNQAKNYRDRLSLLLKNGFMGLLIVLVILGMFLEVRLAFWVMMGMFISFVGGVFFLPFIGVSINMVTMFAFMVVLGIVVDDAIVVGENIHEHRQKGKSFSQAAIDGTREVASPVIFSILTSIVTFIPLLFLPGMQGKFWWSLPAVVIVILLVSLFEALYILPAHLSHGKQTAETGILQIFSSFQKKVSAALNSLIHHPYRWGLNLSLRYRYITICFSILLIVVVLKYAFSAHMGWINMPSVPADEIEAGVRLPVGTTPEQAEKVAEDITNSTMRMFKKHNLHRVAQGVTTNVRGGSFIDVEIVMRPPEEHNMTAAEVISLWRDEIGDIPGVYQITFEAESGPGGWRQDISVNLSHNNIELLEQATYKFEEIATSYENTFDVSHNYYKGKSQLNFVLRSEGRALGLTPEIVGRQLRSAFFGALALRQPRGTNEVEVRVKLPLEERQDLATLENFMLRTPAGEEVPLLDVVDLNPSEAFTSINRRNGLRSVTVGMDVEPSRAIRQVVDAFQNTELPKLRDQYPGLTWSFTGNQEDMHNSTQSLKGGFLLAMLVIYSLLAISFRNYWQPFIVLSAIPFGIVGAVIGHMIMGYDISIISIMGVIALSGVVVNDSLIMIDYANRQRKTVSALEAIQLAGLRRFRPIMLTTLTTFAGLSPIIFETSLQAQYLIPMALSLGFGIVFATQIILFLVPCLYMAMEDFKNLHKLK
jgi:multidrug efflux pump subunit AcrB